MLLFHLLSFLFAIDLEEVSDLQDDTFMSSLETLYENYDDSQATIMQSTETVQVFNSNHKISIEDCKNQIRLAAIAYCPENKIMDKSCSNFDSQTANVDIISTMKNVKYKTLGYVSVNHQDRKISISYRGTKNLSNWILNFHFSGTKFYNDTKIHSGFKHLAHSLLPETLSYVELLLSQFPNYELVFIGHSMGGAVAVINAVEVMKTLKIKEENISVFTYGQPRVGNKKFAKYINSLKWNINRVFNKKDLVPNLPPNFVGFYHTNVGISIKSVNHTNICNPNYMEDIGCSVVPSSEKTPNSHFVYWDYVIKSGFK